MKQIIRVKSSQGQQRLEIDPTKETFIALLNNIASNMGVQPQDITLHPDDSRSPALRVQDKIVIGRIPQLQENGIMIFVKENPKAQQQLAQQVQKTSEPPKPITTPSNYKMEIEEETKKEEQKNNNKMEEEKPKESEYKPKCNHGPKGKCANCLVVDKDKDKIKQQMMKQHCNHGPNGKCIHCLGKEFIASAKHISFDQYWHDRTLKCASLHPRTEKCPHCTPLENPSYLVKRDCKNHKPFPIAMCAKCLPPSISVNRQHFRHVDYCSIMNVKEIGSLVTHWKKSDFSEQRFAWMYGYYAEDPNYPLGIRACVEALYEPPQIGDISGYQLLEDNLKEQADRLAAALGLELIGQIYTSINHDTKLSQQEIRQAAQYQHQYRVKHQTGYEVSKFITCILRTGKQNASDVAPEVYMVSDQAVDMERDNIFDKNYESRKSLKIRKPKDANDIIPSTLAESKPVQEFDPDWFIVNVAVGNMPDIKYNVLKHSEFPGTNRQANDQTNQMVKKFLTRYQREPSYIRFSDFHLLLYIARMVDLDTALTIAQYVAEEKEIPEGTIDFIQQILAH